MNSHDDFIDNIIDLASYHNWKNQGFERLSIMHHLRLAMDNIENKAQSFAHEFSVYIRLFLQMGSFKQGEVTMIASTVENYSFALLMHILLKQMAESNFSHKSVLLTPSVDPEVVALRIMSSAAGIELKSLLCGGLAENDWSKMASITRSLAYLPLFVDNKKYSPADLDLLVGQIRQQYQQKTVLAIHDADLANISVSHLKHIALSRNVPVFLTHTFTAGNSLSNAIDLSHIDHFLFIDDAVLNTSPLHADRNVVINILKNPRGFTGSLECKFNSTFAQFL